LLLLPAWLNRHHLLLLLLLMCGQVGDGSGSCYCL
jgi:hypothetical protein